MFSTELKKNGQGRISFQFRQKNFCFLELIFSPSIKTFSHLVIGVISDAAAPILLEYSGREYLEDTGEYLNFVLRLVLLHFPKLNAPVTTGK